MSDKEIKTLTVIKLNMIMQRLNEPIYKREIEQAINNNQEKVTKRGR